MSKDFKKFWLSASRKIEYFIDETKLLIIVKIASSIAVMLFSNFQIFEDGLIKKIYSSNDLRIKKSFENINITFRKLNWCDFSCYFKTDLNSPIFNGLNQGYI